MWHAWCWSSRYLLSFVSTAIRRRGRRNVQSTDIYDVWYLLSKHELPIKRLNIHEAHVIYHWEIWSWSSSNGHDKGHLCYKPLEVLVICKCWSSRFNFLPFCSILVHFHSHWSILVHFGPYLFTLVCFGLFGPFWSISKLHYFSNHLLKLELQ